MAKKLDQIRGGGGSIRVGTIGTISSLMNKEIESSSKRTPQSAPVSLPCGGAASKLIRRSMDEARGSEGTRRSRGQNSRRLPVLPPGNGGNVRKYKRTATHNVPMLGSEDIALDKTPIRVKKAGRKVSVVEIVDVNCGGSVGSLSDRLKKLGFSKLSQSIV